LDLNNISFIATFLLPLTLFQKIYTDALTGVYWWCEYTVNGDDGYFNPMLRHNHPFLSDVIDVVTRCYWCRYPMLCYCLSDVTPQILVLIARLSVNYLIL